ncbi:MAG: hypothetical protein KME08_10960 [Aphanothece sp. CMT-3BRIN-NPC111]|jgi:uncharacterized Zn finger protein (UPF0148 family)|nr:hypothetical protein [Aphanothece sp. CMT-3BRIN-NPC111]
MCLNTCPCCGSPLLRHARQQGIYWFCTSCRQEMIPLIGDATPRRDILGGRSRIPQTVTS